MSKGGLLIGDIADPSAWVNALHGTDGLCREYAWGRPSGNEKLTLTGQSLSLAGLVWPL